MASDPQRHLAFYGELLGLRLVKRTVNFDDPGTYHFYFGDVGGAPGTLLTVFPWPGAGPGTLGSGETAAVAFRIAPRSVGFWIDRLSERGRTPEVGSRLGDTVVAFDDPDGLRLELIADPTAPEADPWARSPVAEAERLRGLHGVTLQLERIEASDALLTGDLGYLRLGEERSPQGLRRRYRAAGTGEAPGSLLDVVALGKRLPGRLGAGSVHHIAFRSADQDEQILYHRRLTGAGHRVTPVQERNYFRSIYFREPGGVLFEIATDGPGFTVDEAADELGLALKLPPILEADRDAIRARLPQVVPPEYAPLLGGDHAG
jgi:glyoxalase family protein